MIMAFYELNTFNDILDANNNIFDLNLIQNEIYSDIRILLNFEEKGNTKNF